MPAIDHCEAQMIRAFEKAGWIVLEQPYAIQLPPAGPTTVFVDSLLEDRNNRTLIAVEVKCFGASGTALDQFYTAVGQYLLYRTALQMINKPFSLFLAVPESVYNTFFQSRVITNVVQAIGMKLVVVDLLREEVKQWIP